MATVASTYDETKGCWTEPHEDGERYAVRLVGRFGGAFTSLEAWDGKAWRKAERRSYKNEDGTHSHVLVWVV